MAIVLIGIASGTLAFKATLEHKPVVDNDYHWYVRGSDGTYTEFTPQTGLETIDDVCPATGPQICALGFDEPMNPSELDDSDESNSSAQRYKPLE